MTAGSSASETTQHLRRELFDRRPAPRSPGLDADAGVLDLAHQRVAGELVEGDAHRLPVDTDTVDVAVTETT